MRRKVWLVERGTSIVALLVVSVLPAWTAQQYAATGLVLKVNRNHSMFVVSAQEIPGYMDAMVMPLPVRDPRQLDGLQPGMMVNFTLVVTSRDSYAESVRIRHFESLQTDPLDACRLAMLDKVLGKTSSSSTALAIGQHVPDFSLIDQTGSRAALSQFAGKVVAVDFVYTRCPLPNFCFRLSNNFGRLQQRFKTQMGRDLILLTVTLDPDHDRPEELTQYAGIWNANPASWHFLTGPTPKVKQVTSMFGVDYWQDMGMMTHSLHTVIIDRQRNLVANIEGNKFTARELGDFVETVMDHPPNASQLGRVEVSHRNLLSQNSSRTQK